MNRKIRSLMTAVLCSFMLVSFTGCDIDKGIDTELRDVIVKQINGGQTEDADDPVESQDVEETEETEVNTEPFSADGVTGVWYYENDELSDRNGMTTYVNTTSIDFDLGDTPDYMDYSQINYTVAIDGEVIYTSGHYVYMGYYGSTQGAEFNEYGYLNPGIYTVTFYYRGEPILSDSCIVDLNVE